jgi:cytochrome c oxidase subunit 3
MPEARPAFQYATLAQQHEAAELGMWTFLATEVLFFGGLLLAYCVYRFGYPGDFAAAGRHTKIVIGTLNTALLLTSSFVVAWAVVQARMGARRVTAILLVIAALMGSAFLALKGYEYRQEFQEHLVPAVNFDRAALPGGGAELFFMFYFAATGLHAAHVAIGVIVLAGMAVRVSCGITAANDHAPVALAALYWHFVDVVWIVLFALIYLPGRNA